MRVREAWRALWTKPAPPAPRRRSFDAARMGGLMAGWLSRTTAINAEVEANLATLRGRARQLRATNGLAQRFVSMASQNIVGPSGFSVKCLALDPGRDGQVDRLGSKAVEDHFWQWASSTECDYHRRHTLWQLLRVAVESAATDGDVFIRRHVDPRAPYGMRLQLIEGDLVDERMTGTLTNGGTVRMGLELDEGLRVQAYHVLREHPGDGRTAGVAQRIRIPADEVYHVFKPERPHQLRGQTWMRPVMGLLAMLDGYEESAIVAARFGAAKMLMFETPDGDAGPLADSHDDATDTFAMDIEPGKVQALPPGYKPHQWSPDYPHQNFDAFVRQVTNRIASGLGVAAHNLTGDMTGVNYSSARIAELAERDRWMQDQDWLISAAVLPIARDWARTAFIAGAVTLPSGKALPAERIEKFVAGLTVAGRRWLWIDPLKEIQAAREAIDARLRSRTSLAAEQGVDIAEVFAELSAESAEMQRLKIEPAAAAPARPPTPPAAQP
jgi:lambda family phage portal protein